MTSLLGRFKGRREPTSAEIAKERLKLVLVSDRSDLAPEKLHEMQTAIIDVIKRYIRIDEMEVQIKFEQRDRKNYLVADIPLQRERAYEALAGAPEPANESEAEEEEEEGKSPEAAAGPESEAAVEAQPEDDEAEPEKE